MKETNPRPSDRVSYSLGRKISTGNYESVNFQVTFTSDVSMNETVDEALERVSEFVEGEIEKREKIFRDK